MQLLLDADACPDRGNANGATPLFIAAQQGRLASVRLLIEAGADDTLTADGKTALRWAEQNGHTEVAALLRAPRSTTPPDSGGGSRLRFRRGSESLLPPGGGGGQGHGQRHAEAPPGGAAHRPLHRTPNRV